MTFLRYFIDVFRRKPPVLNADGTPAPRNINLGMMHGINRISIAIFAIALLVLLYRWFIK